MAGQELALGSVGVSILLSIILRMVYNATDRIPDKKKPLVSVGLGMALSIVAMFYAGDSVAFKAVVDFLCQGFLVGATGVGFYEMTQNIGKPKTP